MQGVRGAQLKKPLRIEAMRALVHHGLRL